MTGPRVPRKKRDEQTKGAEIVREPDEPSVQDREGEHRKATRRSGAMLLGYGTGKGTLG